MQSPFERKIGLVQPLRQKLQNIMWDGVGVMRERTAMEDALSALKTSRLSFTILALPQTCLPLTLHGMIG